MPVHLSAEYLQRLGARSFTAGELAAWLPPRSPYGHKGTFGHVLLAAGSYGMAGAAVLAARAALRSGSGKVTVHTPSCNLSVLQNAVPEAIVSPDVNTHVCTQLPDAAAFDGAGFGPGLGCSTPVRQMLAAAFSAFHAPMVLDADALKLLAGHSELLGRLPAEAVLTPHPGELRRLFPAARDCGELLDCARRMAADHGVYVLMKGHRTAICVPDGRLFFNTTGNSGMATAGSGDVLTGVLTSLLGQQVAPLEACLLGVYLHGLAGDFAAAALGERSLTASDIIARLPQAFMALEAAACTSE
ncbi:MAG: NAD(P)H-hydrate dehydratase [Prevotellaceae bacterium]|nr:NAD(P)H-hydrate dehydratase [Prevotellaceae bacterium]